MAAEEELDPRLTFYLEHKDQIEEWLKLPELERMAADQFFDSLGDPMEEHSSDLAGSPVLSRNSQGRWKSLLLCRPAWLTSDAQWPLVGIGLEWHAGRTGFEQGYIGIRVEMSIDGIEPLRSAIVDGLEALAELSGFKRTPWWPSLKYMRPSKPRYWEDLDAFSTEITEAVAEHWIATWKVADKAFLEWQADRST